MRVNLANLFGRLVSLAPRKPLTLSRLALRGSRYDAASNVPAIRGDPEARVAKPRCDSTPSDSTASLRAGRSRPGGRHWRAGQGGCRLRAGGRAGNRHPADHARLRTARAPVVARAGDLHANAR